MIKKRHCVNFKGMGTSRNYVKLCIGIWIEVGDLELLNMQ